MAERLSTALRNGQADAIGDDFDSGFLDIYTGSQPASPDDAPTGTLLASIPLPADAYAAAAAGAVAKNGTWQDTSADATGIAGWYRFRTAADGGGSSTTLKRFDGSVTATGGGGDLTLDSTNITAGQTVTINTATITQPAQ